MRRLSSEPETAAGTDLATADSATPGAKAIEVMFAPIKFTARRVAPRLSARLFERIWDTVGRGAPPPSAQDPEASVATLGLALALEGACIAIVSGLVDHVSRRQFARLTGCWPGRRKQA